jgi:hypothetical protein
MFRDRVDDLIGRLTLTEKVGLLHQYQAPIPRLGIGRFVCGREALHGVAGLGPATVFPQAIGLAGSWNPDLVRAVGAATGDEVRGFDHKDPGNAGLNVWAPVVNLLRDPRWGRNEEGYAEDPLLTATGSITVTVDVANRSDRDSDEVIQLYTRQRDSRVKQPLRRPRAFRRVRVPARGSVPVALELRAADLAFWDVVGSRYVVEAAEHDIMVGRSSADIRRTARVRVDGSRVRSWDTGRPFPAVDADAYAGVTLVDADRTDGDAVLATADGGWIAFHGVTFGRGLTGCTARLSAARPGEAPILLRTGDPVDGPVIAKLAVVAAGDRYRWESADAPAVPVSGPADLYVVFPSAGVCLRDLTFRVAWPGSSWRPRRHHPGRRLETARRAARHPRLRVALQHPRSPWSRSSRREQPLAQEGSAS